MHKGMLAWVGLLIAVMMAVPALTVGVDPSPESGSETSKKAADGKSPQPVVKVYLTEEKRVVKLPLETYIRGVVAAEMPHDFHPEALKAQALAARTYIVDRLKRGDFSDMEDMGAAAKGAHVTDTVRHQAYIRDERLKKDWGKQYEANSRRIRDAVAATRGKVILYDGEPIYAAFFSTSNGRTENSEAYFSQAYPYLRSVPSPWTGNRPNFRIPGPCPSKSSSADWRKQRENRWPYPQRRETDG